MSCSSFRTADDGGGNDEDVVTPPTGTSLTAPSGVSIMISDTGDVICDENALKSLIGEDEKNFKTFIGRKEYAKIR